MTEQEIDRRYDGIENNPNFIKSAFFTREQCKKRNLIVDKFWSSVKHIGNNSSQEIKKEFWHKAIIANREYNNAIN